MGDLYPFVRWLTGVTYARAGRVEEARRIAAELEPLQESSLDAVGLAVLYAPLGERDAAFRWLNYEPHHLWAIAVGFDPIVGFPPDLRDDPRLGEFLERIGVDLPARPE